MNYRFFRSSELQCHGKDCCGGQSDMDHAFMMKLDNMRLKAGFPFIITSAYRCPLYNSQISSTGENGPHVTGRAVDILVNREQAYRVLQLAFEYGFTGIGVKQHGLHRYIHIDDLQEGPRPTIWSYT